MRIVAWGSISGARSILENLQVPRGRSDSPCQSTTSSTTSTDTLSRPAWPRTNAAGRDETRPASEVSGAVGKLSSPSCFPACLGIPPPGAGRPRTLIDHLLQFLSYSRLPASNPKPSIKWWTWNLRFSISDLEGRLWLLTPLVGLARNRERSAGFFPLHGYLQCTMPSTRREEKE